MDTDNTVSALLLKVNESFDKFPTLKYAANNARILAEPEKYSAAEIQPCPDGVDEDETENQQHIEIWHSWLHVGEIYYNKVTNKWRMRTMRLLACGWNQTMSTALIGSSLTFKQIKP